MFDWKDRRPRARSNEADAQRYRSYQLFQAAATEAPLDHIECLIEAGADVNIVLTESNGEISTAIARHIHNGIADMLVKEGVILRKEDARGFAPLHLAAQRGNLPLIKLLLEHGADVNVSGALGNAPLHVVADDEKCVLTLLESGADPTICNNYGNVPMLCAAFKGRPKALHGFITFGLDVHTANMWEQTSVHLASQSGCLESVQLLLDKGAFLNAKTVWGDSAVHDAARSRNPKLLRFLVDKGISLCLDSYGDRVESSCSHPRTPLGEIDQEALLPLIHKVIINGPEESVKIIIESLMNRFTGRLTEALKQKNPEGKSAFQRLLTHYPKLVEQILDMCLQSSENYSQAFHRVYLDYSFLAGGSEDCDIDPLIEMIHHKQTFLLQHPICDALWMFKYMQLRIIYFSSAFVIAVATLLVSTYMMLVTGVADRHTGALTPAGFNCIKYILTISGCLSYFSFPFQLFKAKRRRLIFRTDYFLGMLVSFSLVPYIWSGDEVKTSTAEIQFAAFITMLSWLHLLFTIGRFPSLGIYIDMFGYVIRRVIYILSTYSLVFVGFAAAFFILFGRLNQGPFASVSDGFLYTAAMVIGEYDFQDTYLGPDGLLQGTEPSSAIIVIMFLIIVTISMVNLMIGIAVNDIQTMKENARLDKIKREVLFIQAIESSMINSFIKLTLGSVERKKRTTFFGRIHKPRQIFKDLLTDSISFYVHPYNANDEKKLYETSDSGSFAYRMPRRIINRIVQVIEKRKRKQLKTIHGGEQSKGEMMQDMQRSIVSLQETTNSIINMQMELLQRINKF